MRRSLPDTYMHSPAMVIEMHDIALYVYGHCMIAMQTCVVTALQKYTLKTYACAAMFIAFCYKSR